MWKLWVPLFVTSPCTISHVAAKVVYSARTHGDIEKCVRFYGSGASIVSPVDSEKMISKCVAT